MSTSLPAEALHDSLRRLSIANLAFLARFPGASSARQAIHTVYGGAHLFKADTARRLGELARRSLADYAPDAVSFARAVGLPGAEGLPADQAAARFAHTIYARVSEKLAREPVEDFRIDFEDGYGIRLDAEEDGHAAAAGHEVARGLAEGSLPPFLGIRIKPLNEEMRARSLRTLDVFLTALRDRARGAWPGHFVITLPKVTIREQVETLADALDALESALGRAPGTLKLELMVETPQSIFAPGGGAALPGLVEAARGRCVAAHFGTYDYTAGLDVTAAYQHMTHPACDFAKQVMQVTLAGTGVQLSDGATNILPVAPHRVAADRPALTEAQHAENRRVMHAAWRLHYGHVRHSLETAYYQGWDLHPAQLPTRYAAVYAFFLEALDPAAERLRNFVARAAQATLIGEVFDDAATGQGLLNYFVRAINCGALTEAEAIERTGLAVEDLRGRSFLRILERRGRAAGATGPGHGPEARRQLS